MRDYELLRDDERNLPEWERNEIIDRRRREIELSRYISLDWTKSLENFDGEAPKAIVEDFMAGRRGVLIIAGKTGVGKTHLAQGVALKYPRTIMLRVDTLSKVWRELSGWDHDEIFNRIGYKLDEAVTLIIDDLGTERLTESELFLREFKALLDNNEYGKLPKRVIITTNLTADQIANRYGEKIASRLSAAQVLTINGQDRRAALRVIA